MRTLVVYPTFLCPFSCAFCLTKTKNSLNEFLDVFKLIFYTLFFLFI